MFDSITYHENENRDEAPEPSSPPERFYQLIEQYHCPRCEGAIRPDAVQSRLAGPVFGMVGTRRCVKVYCDHCDEIFAASFTLLGGVWQIEDRPALVTRKTRDAFMERLNAVRGNRQDANEIAAGRSRGESCPAV